MKKIKDQYIIEIQKVKKQKMLLPKFVLGAFIEKQKNLGNEDALGSSFLKKYQIKQTIIQDEHQIEKDFIEQKIKLIETYLKTEDLEEAYNLIAKMLLIYPDEKKLMELSKQTNHALIRDNLDNLDKNFKKRNALMELLILVKDEQKVLDMILAYDCDLFQEYLKIFEKTFKLYHLNYLKFLLRMGRYYEAYDLIINNNIYNKISSLQNILFRTKFLLSSNLDIDFDKINAINDLRLAQLKGKK